MLQKKAKLKCHFNFKVCLNINNSTHRACQCPCPSLFQRKTIRQVLSVIKVGGLFPCNSRQEAVRNTVRDTAEGWKTSRHRKTHNMSRKLNKTKIKDQTAMCAEVCRSVLLFTHPHLHGDKEKWSRRIKDTFALHVSQLINKELLRIFSVLLSMHFHTHTLILTTKQLISERLWWFDNRRLLCSEMKGEQRDRERGREGKFDQKYGFWCRTHLRYSETDLKPTVMCVCHI